MGNGAWRVACAQFKRLSPAEPALTKVGAGIPLPLANSFSSALRGLLGLLGLHPLSNAKLNFLFYAGVPTFAPKVLGFVTWPNRKF